MEPWSKGREGVLSLSIKPCNLVYNAINIKATHLLRLWFLVHMEMGFFQSPTLQW